MDRTSTLMALAMIAGLGHTTAGLAVPLNDEAWQAEPSRGVLQTGQVDEAYDPAAAAAKARAEEPVVPRPADSTFGAEAAPNARVDKLLRASTRRLAAERGEIVLAKPMPKGPRPSLAQNRPEEGVVEALAENAEGAVTPAAPIDRTRSLRRSSRGYAYHVAKGATFGAQLADGVTVAHVGELAEGDAPAAGRLVVYPRPVEAPLPLVYSNPTNAALLPLVYIDPDEAALPHVYRDPHQLSDGSEDLASVGRKGFYVSLDVPDNVDITPRVGRFREESPFPPCCGPTQLELIHDPSLGLVITPHPRAFKTGQTFQFVPLTASMW